MIKSPFTSAMSRKYFEHKLPGARLPRFGDGMVKCPFHDDDSPSLSLNIDKGVWNCKGCGKRGGILEWEKLSTGTDAGTAWVQISEIIGHKVAGHTKPERVYVYTDEDDLWLFRKIRYLATDGKKEIFQERYNRDSGKWERGLAGTRQVLYNLPAVVTSNVVIITEGEKCADRVNELGLYKDSDIRCIATTAPGGAVGWRSDYGGYLTGKVVLIFPDNDAPGRKYALDAAMNATERGAFLVKIVELPDLPEGGDVYDYLDIHTAEELLKLVRDARKWEPVIETTETDRFFIDAITLASTVPEDVQWVVDTIIPRGGNGFIVADPKSLKSFAAVDLVIHLACGLDWLGFQVPARVRCAVLAREDAWQLTAWRIKHLLRGLPISPEIGEDLHSNWLLFNTRMQTPNFALDSDADLEGLIRRLKERKVEFLVMDVFRMLFSCEENDNTEMQAVLERVRRIQSEVGCAIAIVHHARKEGDQKSKMNIFHRTRGASAIHGFMEWGIGLTTVNPEDDRRDWIRKMEFLTKNGGEPEPVYVKAEGGKGSDVVRLVSVAPPEKKSRKKSEDVVYAPHWSERDPEPVLA